MKWNLFTCKSPKNVCIVITEVLSHLCPLSVFLNSNIILTSPCSIYTKCDMQKYEWQRKGDEREFHHRRNSKRWEILELYFENWEQYYFLFLIKYSNSKNSINILFKQKLDSTNPKQKKDSWFKSLLLTLISSWIQSKVY